MSDVTILHPRPNVADSIAAAMETLTTTLKFLSEKAKTDPDEVAFYGMELDRADTDISLLRAGLKMKRSTAHLCGRFGKAP